MTFDWLNRFSPQALGVLRIVTALLFAEHGTQKLFGFPASQFGGGGGGGSMGALFIFAGFLETFGGLAIAFGMLTRPVAFVLAGEAAVIFWWMHVGMMGQGNIFPIANGGESAVLFCFVFLYLVFAGPGAFSIDGVLARRRAA